MKCAVNYARIQQRYAQNGDTIIAFVDHLQCLSMREYFQYGADRLMQFDSGTGEMIRFYIDRYTQEIEPDEDYTVNAYYAMVRDLCGYGWDPEDHLWRDSVFDDFPPDKNSAAVCKIREQRCVFAKKISFYAREMCAGMALWLREERGYADIRLTRAISPVRDEYLSLMRHYLRCSRAGDNEARRIIAETHRKYNEMIEKVFKNKRKEG